MLRKTDDNPHHPLWSHDGKALFHTPRPGGFESVPFTTEPTPGFGTSVAVPVNFRTGGPALRAQYDMMPDGRILALMSAADDSAISGVSEIRVVLNWHEELKRLVPTR